MATKAASRTPAKGKSKKSGGRSSGGGASGGTKPIRREVGAVVCFFLGLFCFIGYFDVDALFITLFCKFIKGLIGYGYYIFPPALIMCAYVLATHRGRPVTARTVCTLLLPVALGALIHVLFCPLELDLAHFGKVVKELYTSGQSTGSGGLAAGLLGMCFEAMFSVYGAVPVFIFAFLGLLMVTFRVSPAKIAQDIKNRPRPEYDESMYESPEPAAPKHGASAPQSAAPVRKGRRAIDIPMDETDPNAEEYKEKKVGFFNVNPRVKTPDQVLARHKQEDASSGESAEAPAASAETNTHSAGAGQSASGRDGDSSRFAPVSTFSRDGEADTSDAGGPSPAAPHAPEAFTSSGGTGFGSRAAASQPAAKRPETSGEAHVRAAAAGTAPTDRVAPLTVEEAADIAGVTPVEIKTQEVVSEDKFAPRSRKAMDAEELRSQTEEVARTIEENAQTLQPEYRYPPLELLRRSSGTAVDGREEMAINRERLQATLNSFGVNAVIADITRGPTVTRYDLELEAGVKLTKLTNLAGDLALSLGVGSVRIAPIPDKISTVGVEVPNKIVSTVYLRDIIDSDAFRNASSKLTFAIGEDISGNCICGNISKLPHMLIAGTTGSGKSVCMNSLILSLLYKAKPDEVKLIMIDPKMVELGIYNGIPHLYIPVVTDPKKAAGALQWAVVEMLKRYRLFSEIGVRDLASYNAAQKRENGDTLPQVVIVIDELADLMLVASKEVEESICRVAQMGRAAGMHLIIATQRPSADVITGLMKANIPSRIAFAVSSALESRIILDTQGAEKLMGSGDMLYAPIGAVGKPKRIQGAFVTDEEREKVVEFIKQNGSAEYNSEIIEQIEKAAADKPSASGKAEPVSDSGPKSEFDELLPQAVEVIFETKQASVSMLQRRLKLGYSRAARIVDQMEELGVVGPFEGSKPRQIMITREQWQEMQYINGTAPVPPAVGASAQEGVSADEDAYFAQDGESGQAEE